MRRTVKSRSEEALEHSIEFLRDPKRRIAFGEYIQENFPALMVFVKRGLGQDMLDTIMRLRRPHTALPEELQNVLCPTDTDPPTTAEVESVTRAVEQSTSNFLIHVLAYLYFENLLDLKDFGFTVTEGKVTGFEPKHLPTTECGCSPGRTDDAHKPNGGHTARRSKGKGTAATDQADR